MRSEHIKEEFSLQPRLASPPGQVAKLQVDDLRDKRMVFRADTAGGTQRGEGF